MLTTSQHKQFSFNWHFVLYCAAGDNSLPRGLILPPQPGSQNDNDSPPVLTLPPDIMGNF